jgi:hypothetical protein
VVRSAGQTGAPEVYRPDNASRDTADTADTGHFKSVQFQPLLPGGIRGHSFFVQVFGGDKQ